MKTTEKELIQAQSALLNWYGIKLPMNQLKSLIENDEDLDDEISEWGPNDTCVREVLADCLVKHLMKNVDPPKNRSMFGKKTWNFPLNGDSQEYSSEFHKAFKKAASEAGIELEGWPDEEEEED